MSLSLITPPVVSALSLEEMRLHSRVTGTEEDILLLQAIRASELYAERVTSRSFITSTWRLKLPCFTPVVELPLAPVQSIESVTYIDAAGDSQPFTDFHADLDAEPALLWSEAWPTTARRLDAVTVEFVAGYGGPSEVPELIRSALKLYAADLYEHRENASSKPPAAVDNILRHYTFRRAYA